MGPGRREPAPGSDDGEALAALEAAGLDDLAAVLGGHAGAVADLAGALLTMRTECGFHDSDVDL